MPSFYPVSAGGTTTHRPFAFGEITAIELIGGGDYRFHGGSPMGPTFQPDSGFAYRLKEAVIKNGRWVELLALEPGRGGTKVVNKQRKVWLSTRAIYGVQEPSHGNTGNLVVLNPHGLDVGTNEADGDKDAIAVLRDLVTWDAPPTPLYGGFGGGDDYDPDFVGVSLS